MSKTMDELHEIFRAARQGTREWDGTEWVGEWHGDIAGIAAVVRAVRDEFENEMSKCLDCSASGVHDHIDEVFNRILGAAGDEAAEYICKDARVVTDAGTAYCAPATAPAPVCEWRRISEFDTVTHYSTPHGVMNDLHLWRGLQCSACHAPIKFTEEK